MAMAASLSVCLLLVGMHYIQERTVRRAEHVLTAVREARIDLAMGFVELALANGQQSVFREEQGSALLEQAVRVLERMEARLVREGEAPPAELESPAEFQRKVGRIHVKNRVE